nr:hypothetical protein Z953_p0032 [Clostridium botulinum D str. 16868]
MKHYIRNKQAGFKWVIKTWGFPYELNLDDGDQTYFKFCFDRDYYSKEDVRNIGIQLADDLGIDFVG